MSLKTSGRDPALQAMIQEVHRLPASSARDAMHERIAARAEALGDMQTAWRTRCEILSSSAAHAAPRFETLFLNLAWCLAMHDRFPAEFPANRLLWSYKWVATTAPLYASVPMSVLHRVIDDMNERFLRAGWGPRAGLQKRVELSMLTGNPAGAQELVSQWCAVSRDQGSDCVACEANTVIEVHEALGDYAEAVRHAGPIIGGRLSCATVPHSTFGLLLRPLMALGRGRQADELYHRGRRLVAEMTENGCSYAAPYVLHAARTGDFAAAAAMLQGRLRESVRLQADATRLRTFGSFAVALAIISRKSDGIDLEPLAAEVLASGRSADESAGTADPAERCWAIAGAHAQSLDLRNGNDYYRGWLKRLAREHDVDQFDAAR